MKIFIKPNGTEIAVNEESREAALALGWVPKESAPEPESKKKRGPKPKE